MRIYPVLFLFTMILIVLLNNGCKKNEDPVRIATYELDSIEIVQLNNSGDTVMRFALGLAPNNIDSIMSFSDHFTDLMEIVLSMILMKIHIIKIIIIQNILRLIIN